MKHLVRSLAYAALLLIGAGSAQTITFWHTYNQDSDENRTLVEKVIPAFEKANPGIKVKSQAIPYPDFRQKLLTSIAGGTVPDVARIDIIWSPEFAKLGAIEKLDGYPGFANLRNAVFPGPLSTNGWRGSYYGLPLDTNTQVVLYNADVLKAVGLDAPKTFAELKTLLEKTQEKKGDKVVRWGFAVPGPWNWYLLPWIWSNGGSVTDAAVTRATGYLNGPRTVAAIQMLYDWYKAGLIAPTIAQAGLGSWEGMGAGQYVATQDGPWAYPALKKQYPNLNLAHALFPAGPGGSISVVGGENIVILKESKKKQAAWKFVQFMLSPEAQLMMARTGQLPVIKAALDDPYIKGHPYFGLYLEQLKTARARPVTPAYPKVKEVIQGAFQEIFLGKKTVQAALDEAAAKVDKLLK